MTLKNVKDEILKLYDFAKENDMDNPVIRLYVIKEDDIEIWKEDDLFYYSNCDCGYGTFVELLDDLCKYLYKYKTDVSDIEIE